MRGSGGGGSALSLLCRNCRRSTWRKAREAILDSPRLLAYSWIGPGRSAQCPPLVVPDVMLMDTRTPVRCRADSDQVVEGLVSAVLLSCSLRDGERYNPKEMPGCYARLTRMPPCHHQINGGGQIGGHCMAPLYSVHRVQNVEATGSLRSVTAAPPRCLSSRTPAKRRWRKCLPPSAPLA